MTKKCLDELYLKNKKTPVCYFTFVIDPDHFGKTVENMFHVSFLVKQRQTVLSIGENGLPVLEPIIGRKVKHEIKNLTVLIATLNFMESRLFFNGN